MASMGERVSEVLGEVTALRSALSRVSTSLDELRHLPPPRSAADEALLKSALGTDMARKPVGHEGIVSAVHVTIFQ